MNFTAIREQFPITRAKLSNQQIGWNKDLIYFDHAASTHAPKPVIDAYLKVMETSYANVHRGEHYLSCISTEMFEDVPLKIAKYIGEPDLYNSGSQIVITSNTTSSLDLASHVFSEKEGIVLTSLLEHHSNDLPHRARGEVQHIQLNPDGRLNLEDFEEKMANHKVKLVAVSAGSNVTGYMPPVHEMAKIAHDHGAKILVDAAQRLAHYKIDVKSIDHPEHIDFLAAAGHKAYSPMGSSFLYGAVEDFDAAKPYIPGGGTVHLVTEHKAHFVNGPDRHTFGTPNIAGAIALGAAIDFISDIGVDNIRKHEVDLLKRLLNGMQSIEGVTILGDIPIDQKIGVVTFNLAGLPHEKVSNELNRLSGIATRNGCFCAHPYMIFLTNSTQEMIDQYEVDVANGVMSNLPGAVRASIGIYNTEEEVDTLIQTLDSINASSKN